MPTADDKLSRLDDLDFIARLDPAQIFRLTAEFGEQCTTALRLAKDVDLGPVGGRCEQVVLAGMGGSAAAGDFLVALFDESGTCPLVVSRDYSIPKWVGHHTLVVCSSYSGNTEETLSAYSQALQKKARILCVTSGGKLAKNARENGNALLQIPGGQPPRTALGYMLIGPLHCFKRLNLVETPDEPGLQAFLESHMTPWLPESKLGSNAAKQLAAKLHGTTPVIYGLGAWQGAVAKRWKAQINENAKAPAFANTFPELNHNEILGWKGVKDEKAWSLVSLEDGSESAKMNSRRQFTFDAFPGIGSHRALASGNSLLERMLSLSLFGDFVSLYVAVLEGVDPGDISMLERMKLELATVSS